MLEAHTKPGILTKPGGLTLCPGQEEPKQRTTEEMNAVRRCRPDRREGLGSS